MDLTPQGLWLSMGTPAKLVFAMLIFMLVWCVYVAIERLIAFLRARSQSRALAGLIAKPLAAGDIDGSLQLVNKPEYKFAYLATILRVGLTEYKARTDEHGVEAARRGL